MITEIRVRIILNTKHEEEAIKALEQQSSEDCISRQAAIEAMRELPHEYNTKEQRARTGGIAACQTIIRELPSVHPKTGLWIAMGEGFTPYECSECEAVEFKKSKYCPRCGAKMEVEE